MTSARLLQREWKDVAERGPRHTRNWAPKKGPMRYARRRESCPLTCGLFRNRTTELQGPNFFTTTCDDCNDGAKHRHDCDLLCHDITPVCCQLTHPSSQIMPRIPSSGLQLR